MPEFLLLRAAQHGALRRALHIVEENTTLAFCSIHWASGARGEQIGVGCAVRTRYCKTSSPGRYRADSFRVGLTL